MANQMFNQELFQLRLQTQRLGRKCLFFEKVDTTIDVVAKENHDTLVLAGEQTKGRGQRTNTWLSPQGCAMGSLKLECLKSSFLASRVCFLQHIVALSAAWTLEKINPEKLGKDQVGLKWPNDIMYKGRGQQKLGGILVHTTDQAEAYDITLSFGLNVFNEQPTICLSEILKDSSNGGNQKEAKTSLPTLSIETVVAEMMNYLEEYTLNLTEDKFNGLKKEYRQRCLQIGQTVRDEINGPVKVVDVNDEGYLVGLNASTQQLCTVTKIL